MTRSEPYGAAGDTACPRDPLLLKLALRLLAKADGSQGTQGTGAARLRLDRRELPTLYGQVDAEVLERIELLLHALAATGWVRLVLDRARDFDGFADRRPRLELVDFDALASWSGYQRLADRWQRRLVAHLERHWVDAGDGSKQALLDYLVRAPIAALEAVPAEDAMRSLQLLRDLCLGGVMAPLREASARAFQGHSKVLDRREELLRVLGASPDQFWVAPIQVLVDVPPTFDEALFVENLVTFERMADQRHADWQRSLLLFAAGFRGSSKRLRIPGGYRIYFRAVTSCQPEPTPITAMIEQTDAWLLGDVELPVRFFGDLDYAGMQILRGLRDVFASAEAWRPGYGELAGVLSSDGGHPPLMAGKHRQEDPGITGCTYADDVLLPLMRRTGRFVDQEGFEGADDA